MSRIEKKFEELNGRTAFISYITAGDPHLSQTKELVLALVKGGSDIIELGIPYSDPIADGPVIQHAAQRALNRGATIDKIFEVVIDIRKSTDIPLVFLVYFNSIYARGAQNFIEDCSKIGIDGLIIPDLSVEEREEILPFLKNKNIDLIPLVAPNSKDRIPKILENGSGFVYCISSFGVTGTRTEFASTTAAYLEDIKKHSKLPVAIGFGISRREDVKVFEKIADGVIVGSELVKIIDETNGDIKIIEEKVKYLKG